MQRGHRLNYYIKSLKISILAKHSIKINKQTKQNNIDRHRFGYKRNFSFYARSFVMHSIKINSGLFFNQQKNLLVVAKQILNFRFFLGIASRHN